MGTDVSGKVLDYFKGRRVLITGGSSGIGLATARRLRGCGAHLILLARDAEKLDGVKAELLGQAGGDAVIQTLSVDVGDLGAVEAAVRTLLQSTGVDILINNAGVVMPGHFLELPQAQFDEMMRINFMGSVHLTRLLLPAMIERGAGHVAFVSSLGGLMGIFGYTAYAASKFAIRGFAEALRCEVKPRGVRVSVIYPPDTETPQHAFEQRYLPDETRAIAGNAKCLSADEVAMALLKGMAAGGFQIVPGFSSRMADVAYRLFPGMVRSMFDGDVRKAGSKKS
ncbi:MAG: SDR family oxidoreductase [Pseudomonadota bacterium]